MDTAAENSRIGEILRHARIDKFTSPQHKQERCAALAGAAGWPCIVIAVQILCKCDTPPTQNQAAIISLNEERCCDTPSAMQQMSFFARKHDRDQMRCNALWAIEIRRLSNAQGIQPSSAECPGVFFERMAPRCGR